jgi:hypothetical protein
MDSSRYGRRTYDLLCIFLCYTDVETAGYCTIELYTRVYPNVSGLAGWSENCKWYISLPLGAVVSLFCESV